MHNCWYTDALYGDTPWRLGADGSRTAPFDGTLTYINMQNQSNKGPAGLADQPARREQSRRLRILWFWVNYT